MSERGNEVSGWLKVGMESNLRWVREGGREERGESMRGTLNRVRWAREGGRDASGCLKRVFSTVK